MKIKKRAIIAVMSMAVLMGSMAVSASAANYAIGPFSAGVTVGETANYNFDNNPGNQIRFIANPRCVVAGAQVRYNLHTFWNYTRPDTQYGGVGGQVRPWWFADTGKHHVDFYVFNNNIDEYSLASVTMAGTTYFQNFVGEVWG